MHAETKHEEASHSSDIRLDTASDVFVENLLGNRDPSHAKGATLTVTLPASVKESVREEPRLG